LSFLNFSSATIPDPQSPQAIILVKANSLVPNEDLDIGNARLLAGASGRRQFVTRTLELDFPGEEDRELRQDSSPVPNRFRPLEDRP